MSKEKPALIVKNKTASRNYVLGDSFQAGIVLEGWEVKSLRNGKIEVKNSYVTSVSYTHLTLPTNREV